MLKLKLTNGLNKDIHSVLAFIASIYWFNHFNVPRKLSFEGKNYNELQQKEHIYKNVFIAFPSPSNVILMKPSI